MRHQHLSIGLISLSLNEATKEKEQIKKALTFKKSEKFNFAVIQFCRTETKTH